MIRLWTLYVALYIVIFIIHTQLYKVALRSSRDPSALTINMFLIADLTALILSWFIGDYRFPTDRRLYAVPVIAGILYGITDLINARVRQAIEASTFSVLSQISTVFVIVIGVVFMGETPSVYKSLGALCIVAGNLLIFYRKGKSKFNKPVGLGLVASLIFAVALSLDVGISGYFNIAFYKALTVSVSLIAMVIVGRIRPQRLIIEFKATNVPLMAALGILQGAMLVTQITAYNTGEIAVVAPLCALTVIGNVIVGYLFLKERDNLGKKLIAAIGTIIGAALINLGL